MTEPTNEGSWDWYAGSSEEEFTIGPVDSREAAIAEAIQNELGEFKDENGQWKLSFHIVEALKEPLRFANWVDVDQILERTREALCDDEMTSEHDDDAFSCTREQEQDLTGRIKKACDEWQAAHGLVFIRWTFSDSRNEEHIIVPHPTPVASSQ